MALLAQRAGERLPLGRVLGTPSAASAYASTTHRVAPQPTPKKLVSRTTRENDAKDAKPAAESLASKAKAPLQILISLDKQQLTLYSGDEVPSRIRGFRPACAAIRPRPACSASFRRTAGTAPISMTTRRCSSCSGSPGPASRCTRASSRTIRHRTAASACPRPSPTDVDGHEDGRARHRLPWRSRPGRNRPREAVHAEARAGRLPASASRNRCRLPRQAWQLADLDART